MRRIDRQRPAGHQLRPAVEVSVLEVLAEKGVGRTEGGGRSAVGAGRALNFDKQDHVKLLVSIAQLMGMSLTSVGDIVPSSGGLTGLV